MRHVLVTGANKGIGLAIVEAILMQHEDTFVFLGSRDLARGREAAARLVAVHPRWTDRLEVVALDVGDPASVEAARAAVSDRLGAAPLYGVVNNAGIGTRGASLPAVMETNMLGVQRVSDAFASLLEQDGGRVVNVTSASGPIFVAQCSNERKRFFVDPGVARDALLAFVAATIAAADDPAAQRELGLGDADAYGLSKACANTFTAIFARERPRLVVNACTPGFIETDMTRHYAASSGRSGAELGMKKPADGARAPMHLLFGALEGNGRFYGSDAKRSPLDRYRAPGDPEYMGA
jgi:NAD(P)-dependent dehydrogenase (short-subunit alcohol dehydrogenase family)